MRSETNKKICKKINDVHHNVSNVKQNRPLFIYNSSSVNVSVYLLFAELPDGQDVLAHQRVQQRRRLEVGHLSNR